MRLSVLLLAVLLLMVSVLEAGEELRFSENFDADLSRWSLVGFENIGIRNSGDDTHGRVLELRPNGAVYALVNGSETWGSVRVEADFLFPDDRHNYLGLIYNFTRSPVRTDFGSIYIKGNGSYLRANPWRDGNASRLLYEEYRTPLEGADAVAPGQWQRLMAEIDGNVCHFYVGDMKTPKLTFDLFEGSEGKVGFKPRVVGWPVWIDNVKITSIDGLTWTGPDIPPVTYDPGALLTDWSVFGPTDKLIPEIESDPWHADYTWEAFETDRRGAVISGRTTEYAGARRVAYYRTVIGSSETREVVLHITTTDELGLFVNGVFNGYVYRDGYISGENDWNAWHDFWKNGDHSGRKVPIELRQGDNVIVIRSHNGHFASGGFFVRLEE